LQAYLSLPPSADKLGAKQPPKRLVGFARIALAPGKTGQVSITIDPKASHHPMGVWNEKAHLWTIPKGRFTVLLGSSSAPGDLKVAGQIEQ
jgi:beta-glucosidase